MPGSADTVERPIETRNRPTFFFIGVTTAHSSIMRVFPLWMEELGRPEVAIAGIDLLIHDRPERYRQAVALIKDDPLSPGALITTHKIDLLEAARDMFDRLGPYAQTCGEVSCISKHEGALVGSAIDPVASGICLAAVLGPGYFGCTGSHVLCFGAGGAATAIALHLIGRPDPGDRPSRFTVINRSPARLARLEEIIKGTDTDVDFVYVCNEDPVRNDEILAEMPEGTLVINATGMGKDRPGSPITDAGSFPRHGVAWELNYRGELDFLRQALAQQESRDLTVEDGWRYFIHGWTQAIEQVLHLEIDEARVLRLNEIAASVR